jgi:hypothetical protein
MIAETARALSCLGERIEADTERAAFLCGDGMRSETSDDPDAEKLLRTAEHDLVNCETQQRELTSQLAELEAYLAAPSGAGST